MRSGDIAWLAMALGVIAYEIGAPRGELLSEACDRYRARRPVATYAAIIFVAGHLARIWPRRIDPLCIVAEGARRGIR